MSAGLTLTLLALTATQANRRPVLTVSSDGVRAVAVHVTWNPTTDPETGAVYARYEWEARDAATLVAGGTTDDATAAFQVTRPTAGDTLLVRVFVRGHGSEGPGPWGWGSEPLVVPGSVGPPDRRPRVTVDHESDSTISLNMVWFTDTGDAGGPFPSYVWELRGATGVVASGTTSDTSVIIALNRPAGGAALDVRGVVRGTAPAGPGPWGVASDAVRIQPLTTRTPPTPTSVAPDTTVPPVVSPPEGRAALPPDPIAPPPTRRSPVVAVTPTPTGDAREPTGFAPIAVGSLLGEGPDHRHFGPRDDAEAPITPPAVVEVIYPAGLEGGKSPGRVVLADENQLTGFTTLYLRYAVKLDTEFEGHASALNPLFAIDLGEVGLFDLVSGAGRSALQYQVGLRGRRPACQLARPAPRAQRLVPNQAVVPLSRNRWYVVELLVRPGTPGRCDGSVRVWFDGELTLSYDDVGLGRRDAPPFAFDGVAFYPRWGVGGSTVERPFRVWIDDVYVSGRN